MQQNLKNCISSSSKNWMNVDLQRVLQVYQPHEHHKQFIGIVTLNHSLNYIILKSNLTV